MAEKILALLVAFVAGAATMWLVSRKLIYLGLRYHAGVRSMLRAALDKADLENRKLGE